MRESSAGTALPRHEAARREAEEAALRRGESIDDEDGDDAWLEGEDEVDWLADEDVDDWLFPETKKDSRDQEDFST